MEKAKFDKARELQDDLNKMRSALESLSQFKDAQFAVSWISDTTYRTLAARLPKRLNARIKELLEEEIRSTEEEFNKL